MEVQEPIEKCVALFCGVWSGVDFKKKWLGSEVEFTDGYGVWVNGGEVEWTKADFFRWIELMSLHRFQVECFTERLGGVWSLFWVRVVSQMVRNGVHRG